MAVIVFRNAAFFSGRPSRLLPHGLVAVEAAKIKKVIEAAPPLISGPRLCPPRQLITMTGGPSDMRNQLDCRIASCRRLHDSFAASAAEAGAAGKAVRKVLRGGGSLLSLFVSRSVLFPTRALGSTRFSRAEVCAATEEADRNDLPPARPAKLDGVCEVMLRSPEILKRARVETGLGTDACGAHQVRRGAGFRLPAEILSDHDILDPAMSVVADVIKDSGRSGGGRGRCACRHHRGRGKFPRGYQPCRPGRRDVAGQHGGRRSQ